MKTFSKNLFILHGVGRSLFLSFLTICLLLSCVAYFGWYGQSSVRQSLNRLVMETYPSVRNVQSVALEMTEFVLRLSNLSSKSNINFLNSENVLLINKINNINHLMSEVEFVEEKPFNVVKTQLEISIKFLESRLSKLITLYRNNIDINAKINLDVNLLSSVILSSISSAKEVWLNTADKSISLASNPYDYKSFTSFSELVINDMHNVSSVQYRLDAILMLLFSINEKMTLDQIDLVEQNVMLNVRSLVNSSPNIKKAGLGNDFFESLSTLANDFLVEKRLFSLIKKRILINDVIAQEQASANETAENVRDSVNRFLLKSEGVLDDRNQETIETANFSQRAALLSAFFALLFSGIIYYVYVSNTIVSRLQSLSQSVSILNKGNLTKEIMVSGEDEITDLATAIESFRKNSLQLQKVEHDLDLHAKDLERSNKDLRQFAYVASHDLRAPLRGINSLVEWIEEDIEEGDHEAVTANIVRLRGRVSRMNALLNGILAYSRAGVQGEEIAEVNIRDVCHEIFSDISNDVDCTLNIISDVTTLRVKETSFRQIILNLFSNAFTHADKDKVVINLSLTFEGGQIMLCVEDNGPGIPEKMRQRVFEMFQTLKSRDDQEASGIGLALVKKLVDRKGGTVRIEDSVLGGAKFCVLWPSYS